MQSCGGGVIFFAFFRVRSRQAWLLEGAVSVAKSQGGTHGDTASREPHHHLKHFLPMLHARETTLYLQQRALTSGTRRGTVLCLPNSTHTTAASLERLPIRNTSRHAKPNTMPRIDVTMRARKLEHGDDSPTADASDDSSSTTATAHVPAAAFGSVDHALDAIGVGRSQFFVLFCVSLIWAGDAMEVMVLSYLGPAAACQFGFSAFQQSLLASVVFGGMVLGAACWGVVADTFGRKRALLWSAAVVVTAGLASAAAPTYTLLLLTRACVGFGLAGAPVAFTLLLEVLPASSRSTYGTLVELAWTAGTVLEAGLAWALLNSAGWRWLLLASVAPLALLLIAGQRLQESPRFLLADGQTAAAQAVLQQMAATNGIKQQAVPMLLAEESNASSLSQQQQEQQALLPAAVNSRQSGSKVGSSSSSSNRSRTGQPNHTQDSSSHARSPPKQQIHTDRDSAHEQHALLGSPAAPNRRTEHDRVGQSDQQRIPPPPPPPQQQLQQQQQRGDEATGASRQSLDIESPKMLQQHHAIKSSGNAAVPNQLQQIIREVKLASKTLTKQPYASTTALMMFGWAATSFAYYGLVQLVAELHIAAPGGAGAAAAGPKCVDQMLEVPNQDYISVLVTSAAEVPAVAWAAVSANWLGKQAAVCTSLLLTAVCLLPVIGASVWGADSAAGGGITDASMFGARLFVMSAFTLMWVFTPELFPTHVRALALGINNASARIGGLLSPFAAVALVSSGAPAAAEGLFAVMLVAACGAVLLVPGKHGGVGEQDMEEDLA